MSQNKISLDAKQKEAVKHPYDKPLLVAAGPGSGKTTVVAERVKHLINDQHIDPDKILCMTFTRAGKRAMLDKLRNDPDLKPSDRKQLTFQIRTFHSLCVELLLQPNIFRIKANANDNDYEYNYEYEGNEWKRILKERMKDNRLEFSKLGMLPDFDEIFEELIEGVSAFKKENLGVDDLKKYLADHQDDLKKYLADHQDDLDYLADHQDEHQGKLDDQEYREKLDDLRRYFEEYEKYKDEVCVTDTTEYVIVGTRIAKDFMEHPITDPPYPKDKCGHSEKYHTWDWLDKSCNPFDGKCNCKGYNQGHDLDFDDTLGEVLNVEKYPGGPKKLYDKNFQHPNRYSPAAKIEHLIVDEFQDNNYLQFEIAKKLAPEGRITVVGDINQSIYSFQGANPEIFNEFKETYKNFTQITLEYNYRSTPQVIRLADRLLKKDPDQKHYDIQRTDNDSGEKVKIYEFSDNEKEIEFFKEIIMSKIGTEFTRLGETKTSKIKFKDFVIIARTNKIRKFIRNLLVRKYAIPCRSKGATTIEYSPYNTRAELEQFLKNNSIDGNSNLDVLVKKLELYFHEDEKPYKILHNLASDYKDDNKNATVKNFQSSITGKDVWKIENAVQIGTAHSVKGLEYSFVIISNSYDMHFPLKYQERELKVPLELLKYQSKVCPKCTTALTDNSGQFVCKKCNLDLAKYIHRKEERRLYYVAMTRATHELFLTFAIKDKDSENERSESVYWTDLEYSTDVDNIDYKDKDEEKIPVQVQVPGTPPSVGGATAYRTYTCPDCKGGKIEQNPDGSEFCLNCGWKS